MARTLANAARLGPALRKPQLLLACAALALFACAADEPEIDPQWMVRPAPSTVLGAGKRASPPPLAGQPLRLVVKFREGSEVALRDGQLLLARTDGAAAPVDTSGLARVTSELAARGVALRRLFESVSDDQLRALRARGEARTKRPLSDLRLYHQVQLSESLTPLELEQLRAALAREPLVEQVYLESPPAPPPDADTPDFASRQRYKGPAPTGIEAEYAATLPGGSGAGVRVVDVEDLLVTAHEDLPAPAFTRGESSSEETRREHAVAVAGVIVGKPNAYGISGIATEASYGSSSVYPWTATSTAEAILAPIASGFLREGDVMVVESQRYGASEAICLCTVSACTGYLPEEYLPASFDAIATATANGIVVIEPAGNGSVGLDDPAFEGAFDRAQRDSGAILVAARYADFERPICFSNSGARVDLNAWGEGVASTGFGDAYQGALYDNDRYTFAFAGTSAAAAIAAGAVASLQGFSRARYGRPLTPFEVRSLLGETGTPQRFELERPIGVQPNLRAAVERLAAEPPLVERSIVADFERGIAPLSVATVGVNVPWTRATGPTPTAGTGPDADHTTGSGAYMYIEASGNGVGYPNKTAVLQTDCLNLRAASRASFRFYYHMVGSDLGRLVAEADPDCDGQDVLALFTQSRAIEGRERSGFALAEIDLAPFLGSSVRLRLRGVTGAGPRSDIAVDDVAITITERPDCTRDGDCAGGVCRSGLCTLACEEFTGTTQEHIEAGRASTARSARRVEARLLGSRELLEARSFYGRFSTAARVVHSRGELEGYALGPCPAPASN